MKALLPPMVGNFWDSNSWDFLRPYGHMIHDISVMGNTPALAAFLSACPNLFSFSCTKCDDSIWSEMILLRAAQSCPLLEDVFIQAYTTAALLELSRNCKKLRKFSFLGTRSRPGLLTTDLTIFNQFETLEELSLCVDLTSELINALSRFRNLKILKLDCYSDDDGIFADVKFVGTAISRTLEKVSFAGGPGVIPVAFLSCFSACTNLREISLDMGCRCDDACFHILATHFPLLEKIALNYINEHVDGLIQFLTQSKRLKIVNLLFPNSCYGYHTNDNQSKADFQNHSNDLRFFFPHILIKNSPYYQFN